MRAVYDRYGLAPVPLAVERPVLHLVVGLGFADTRFLHIFYHLRDGGLDGKSVEEAGVHHYPRAFLGAVGLDLNVYVGLDDFDDGKIVFLGEIPVALVVRRYRHNGSRAVIHHYVVCREYRYFGSRYRINGDHSFDFYTCLVFVDLYAVEFLFELCLRLIRRDFVRVHDARSVLFEQGMFGRHDEEGGSEDGVGSRGIHDERILRTRHFHFEGDVRALRFAYPVLLLRLDTLGEIHFLKPSEQSFRIVTDLEEPYVLFFLYNLGTASVADASLALFVGEHDFAFRAEVDGGRRFVRESAFEHLQEYPLSPFVIVGVRGVHHARPIEAVTYLLELGGEFRYVLVGNFARMLFRLHRVVFGGQPECVVSDREQDVISFEALLARDDFHRGKRSYVTDVQSRAARIREFYQTVEFRFGRILFYFENVFAVPVILPLLFNALKIVLYCHKCTSCNFRLTR